MKYHVTGIAFIPVEVAVDVDARDAADAIIRVSKMQLAGSRLKPYIVGNSEDHGAGFDFHPTSATPHPSPGEK